MFSWFRRSSVTIPPELEARLQTLEASNRSLLLEWTDAHEKILHALDRLRKRIPKQEEVIEEPKPPQDEYRRCLSEAKKRGLLGG